ncbi:CPBP family intramembrane glutamic endopeptidase [Enterococcus sp. DIV0756]|uniref:CPBP family intramembrane glutamic endopeptidase n=1 Tax=Enterococcus sp. DIV0756 TaxID=2774636 RepID=UPI003F22F6DE
MYENQQKEKKQLLIFSAIAFGMPVIMGFLMWYGYGQQKNLDLFASVHMFYPAAGVMIASLFYSKEKKLLPKPFYICYLAQTTLIIVLCLSLFFTGKQLFNQLASIVILIGALVSLPCLFLAKDEQNTAYGLTLKNGKSAVRIVLLYLFLYIARIVIALIIDGSFSQLAETFSNPSTWVALISLPISFFLSFIPFFGEEYGWRYFLQPILQKHFGALNGVLLLGFVWGIWHLPLNFFYYTSPADGIISVANQIVVCMTFGIFYAYAYMKTDNIWTVVVMHFLNNHLIPIFSGDLSGNSIKGNSITWSSVVFSLIVMTVCYAWPVLTKFFRDLDNLNPTPEHRAASVAHSLSTEHEQVIGES